MLMPATDGVCPNASLVRHPEIPAQRVSQDYADTSALNLSEADCAQSPKCNPMPLLMTQEELEAAGLSTIVDRSKAAEDIRKLAEADERLPEAVVKAFDDAMRSSGRSVQSVFDALALPESAEKGAL